MNIDIFYMLALNLEKLKKNELESIVKSNIFSTCLCTLFTIEMTAIRHKTGSIYILNIH